MSKKLGRPRISPKDRKSVMFTVVTTEETKRAVQAEALTQDRSVGAVIRIALAKYLKASGDRSR